MPLEWYSHIYRWVACPLCYRCSPLLLQSAQDGEIPGRSAPWSFDRRAIDLRSSSRASSRAFGWLERDGGHLVAEDLFDPPDMIGQTRCHGWSATQLLMDPAQIGGASNQIHAPLHGLKALTGMPASAGVSGQAFAPPRSVPFNEGAAGLLGLCRAL